MANKRSVNTIDNSKHSNEKSHISLSGKITIYAFLLAIFVLLSLISSLNIIEKEGPKPINYNERGVIDYKVYLKENDFYSEKYLPRGKTYIANLVDYIDADISYIFTIDEKEHIDFEYKIVGELVIENVKGTSRYFEKKYDITKPQKKELDGNNEIIIKDNIKVDYGKYNTLANKFRSQYGIDSNSYLKIYISVTKKTDDDAVYPLNETNDVDIVSIPLSERAIEININSNDSTVSKQINPPEKIIFHKGACIITGIFALIAFFLLIKIIIYVFKAINRCNKYDKRIKKILRDYDRLIVEISTNINYSNYNIIKVKKFPELLDVRDNLKLPINYYVIEPHKKGLFYIKCNDDIYMLLVSDTNIDECI